MNASPERQPDVELTQEKWNAFQGVTRSALDLCTLFQTDFLIAWHRVTDSDFEEEIALESVGICSLGFMAAYLRRASGSADRFGADRTEAARE